ncbi:bifunctional transcriptional activator/DNA repair protein Ada [Nitrospira defluvii]|nr:bifunctional transcriptional activator/DNA repair protein Ada [Nitrospira defluvii]
MLTIERPGHETLYSALMEKDSAFEGVFFFGVKTTGIFCRPTCTAKKPKEENVEYFTTAKEALSYGYRACLICHPMALLGQTPPWLQGLLEDLNDSPDIRMKDADLRSRNINPARIRRWFKKHHGMTFQAYMRAMRINKAFGQIKHKHTVTNAAFGSGYDSLSGFSEAFKHVTGFSPSESQDKQVVSVTRILSPLGPMFAAATEEGICLLEFNDRRMLETQIRILKKRLKAVFIPGGNRHFIALEKQLNEYFSGERKEFDLPLVLPGTPFQIKVWRELQSILFGETRSYQAQATAIGNPKAVRAVATANGDNRIAILIPCHRVIGKDGSLTGYGGGLWRKQRLLDLERA